MQGSLGAAGIMHLQPTFLPCRETSRRITTLLYIRLFESLLPILASECIIHFTLNIHFFVPYLLRFPPDARKYSLKIGLTSLCGILFHSLCSVSIEHHVSTSSLNTLLSIFFRFWQFPICSDCCLLLHSFCLSLYDFLYFQLYPYSHTLRFYHWCITQCMKFHD